MMTSKPSLSPMATSWLKKISKIDIEFWPLGGMLEQLTFRILESDGQVICRNCFHVVPINYFVIRCLIFQYNVVFKIVAVDAICKLRFLFCLFILCLYWKSYVWKPIYIIWRKMLLLLTTAGKSPISCLNLKKLMERRSLSAALQLSILKFEISSEPSCAWEIPRRNPFSIDVLILKIL